MTKDKNINPAVAGIAGAAIGAVAGVVLSNKKVRKQIGNTLTETKEKGEKVYHELQRKGQRVGKELKEKVDSEKRKTIKQLKGN